MFHRSVQNVDIGLGCHVLSHGLMQALGEKAGEGGVFNLIHKTAKCD